MDIYWVCLFFLLGLILGSFYNVIGLRIPSKQSFTKGRSACPTCHHQLSWFELIPFFSYFFQRGRCRYCHHKISLIYPFIEITTGFLFAYSYLYFGFTYEFVASLLLISLSMIILVTDLTSMLIPNKILLFFLPLFIGVRIISPLDPWYDAIIGALVGYTVLAAIIILSQGGMGGGDMKLFGILGIILGWKKILLTLFLASLLGAIIGIILLSTRRLNRKQPIPFGPYIIFAALVSYFFGNEIVIAYLLFF